MLFICSVKIWIHPSNRWVHRDFLFVSFDVHSVHLNASATITMHLFIFITLFNITQLARQSLLLFCILFISPSFSSPSRDQFSSAMSYLNENNFPHSMNEHSIDFDKESNFPRGNWFHFDRNVKYFHSDTRCMHQLINSHAQESISVITKYGKVTGAICYLCDLPGNKRQSSRIIKYHVLANVSLFLGIPYAKAPSKENQLRFKPPVPPDHWASIETLQYRNSCPQPVNSPYASTIVKMNEDCLYMNIFSPSVSCPLHQPPTSHWFSF